MVKTIFSSSDFPGRPIGQSVEEHQTHNRKFRKPRKLHKPSAIETTAKLNVRRRTSAKNIFCAKIHAKSMWVVRFEQTFSEFDPTASVTRWKFAVGELALGWQEVRDGFAAGTAHGLAALMSISNFKTHLSFFSSVD